MALEHKDCGAALGFLPNGKFDDLACIQDYDAIVTKAECGKELIRYGADATYEVVNRCEYGCAYHCKLVGTSGKTDDAKEQYRLHCSMLFEPS